LEKRGEKKAAHSDSLNKKATLKNHNKSNGRHREKRSTARLAKRKLYSTGIGAHERARKKSFLVKGEPHKK